MKQRWKGINSILTSVLCILLCLSVILGATMAWFTASTSNTGNRIRTGEMKVELWKHNGTTYEDISDGVGDIFNTDEGSNGILWEPGKTEIVFLQIKNTGNLALNYNFILNTMIFPTYPLNNVLSYAILPDVTYDSYGALSIDSWEDILAFSNVITGNVADGETVASANGALTEGTSNYFAFAVHMNENVGNEYQNRDIIIDVQISAKQMVHESDSFGDQYDADADYVGTTYYVAPNGSDGNPGTETEPWATFRRAAQTLKPGDTAIFEDGTYYEGGMTLITNSGIAGAPITYKARNPLGAKIIYPATLTTSDKISMYNKEYITIEGFDISQVKPATASTSSNLTDVMVRANSCNNITIRNNRIGGCYEEPLKFSHCSGVLAEGNILYDSEHEGIDAVNSFDCIYRDNQFYDIGRIVIMSKGGARNYQIYNNYIENTNTSGTIAIEFGGVSGITSAWGVTEEYYEGMHQAAWNNVIVSKTPGAIDIGISFRGAYNCAAYNNVVIGANYGVRMCTAPCKQVQWKWDPVTENPILYNNIIMDSVKSAYKLDNNPVNLVSDYNLFYNNGGTDPVEAHSVYTDPMFVDKNSDWHLQPGSPAIGAGNKVDGFEFITGETVFVGFDREYKERSATWDIGPYSSTAGELYYPGMLEIQNPDWLNEIDHTISEGPNYIDMPEQGTVLMRDDFSGNLDNWIPTDNQKGSWEIVDGKLSQTVGDNSSRVTIRYNDGLGWTDYAFSGVVQSPAGDSSTISNGIIFRSDADMKNMYAFRFPDGSNKKKMEFCMWNNGTFASLKFFDYVWEADTTYELKVVAVGNAFEFYVNDLKIGYAIDGSHTGGTVGLYTFNEARSFDDLEVTSMRGYKIDIPTEDEEEPLDYGEVLLMEDFANADINDWQIKNGVWAIRDGVLVHEQGTDQSATARLVYKDGKNWKNYEFSADVSTVQSFSGILFRASEDASSFYCVRLLNQNLQVIKVVNGTQTDLFLYAMTYTQLANYNIKVVAIGNTFKVYINNALKYEFEDSDLPTGSIGFFCTERFEVKADNIKVTEILTESDDDQGGNGDGGSDEPPVYLLNETFDNAEAVSDWYTVNNYGAAVGISDGKLNITNPGQYGCYTVYEPGLAWTDYEVTAEIPMTSSWNGLLLRANKDRSGYVVRYANNILYWYEIYNGAYAESSGGGGYKSIVASVSSLEGYQAEKPLSIKVTAVGNTFTIYAYGKEITKITDDTYASGTVGYWASQTASPTPSYDNLVVIDKAEKQIAYLLDETFDNAEKVSDWYTINNYGASVGISNGKLNVTNRGQYGCYTVYEPGLEWTDYEVVADIPIPTASNSSLLVRANKERSGYVLRYLNNKLYWYVFTNAQYDSSTAPIVSDVTALEGYQAGQPLSLKVTAVGNTFTIYAYGKQIAQITDNTYSAGTVGFWCTQSTDPIPSYEYLQVIDKTSAG